MRALVTGCAGFVGSHLCEELLTHGHSVVGLDDFSTGSALNVLGVLDHPGFTLVRGSILDRPLVDSLVAGNDHVFHLAAAVGVHNIVDDPLRSLRTNMRGTENVLEAAVAHDRRVLITSTSEVYGKNTSDRLAEDADRIMGSALKSRWSYAEAKALDEMVAYTYWQTHGLRVVITRLFNTIGPRQTGRYGMVVPRLVEQALTGQPLTVFDDGTQTRCFINVRDVVPALVKLIDHTGAYGQAVNLGGCEETSINDLAALILELTGAPGPITHVPYEEAYGSGFEDMRRRVPDTARAQGLVDFAPAYTLRDTITMIIADLVGRRAVAEAGWIATSGATPLAAPLQLNGHVSVHGSPIVRNGNGHHNGSNGKAHRNGDVVRAEPV